MPQTVMCNDWRNMKHLIGVIYFSIFPLLCSAQLDSLTYCLFPDKEAEPPFKTHELLNVLLDNHQHELPDCFDLASTFYYNIIILEDGNVAEYNLECVFNGNSCFISVDDVSKLDKWKPAISDGKNCNQKMRIKTYIHFE